MMSTIIEDFYYGKVLDKRTNVFYNDTLVNNVFTLQLNIN